MDSLQTVEEIEENLKLTVWKNLWKRPDPWEKKRWKWKVDQEYSENFFDPTIWVLSKQQPYLPDFSPTGLQPSKISW